MTDTTRTYSIPEQNRDLVETRLAKFVKAAAKLGLPEPTATWSAEPVEEKRWKDDDGFERVTRTYGLTLDAAEPKLAGWTFVAILSPTTEGTLIAAIPGQYAPAEYRDTDLSCDHCGTVRNRKEVYLVRNEEGEHKQIGSTCLRDFMGHGDPHQIAGWAEALINLEAYLSSGGDYESMGGTALESTYALLGYLLNSAFMIRTTGWTSRTQAREGWGRGATADRVLDIYFGTPDERAKIYKTNGRPTDEDRDLAMAALEWAAGHDDESSDYLYAIGILGRLASLELPKHAGLGTSIIATYQRHLEGERKRELTKDSEHIGEIGQRLDFMVTVLRITILENAWPGQPTKRLLAMADLDGNILKTFTTALAAWEMKEGETYAIRATVKKHEIYNGRKETLVTRLALI